MFWDTVNEKFKDDNLAVGLALYAGASLPLYHDHATKTQWEDRATLPQDLQDSYTIRLLH